MTDDNPYHIDPDYARTMLLSPIEDQVQILTEAAIKATIITFATIFNTPIDTAMIDAATAGSLHSVMEYYKALQEAAA